MNHQRTYPTQSLTLRASSHELARSLWLSLFTLSIFHSSTVAQDVHFSQFHLSPLTLNPAQAGAIEDDQRFVANYRDQWSSLGNPFITYSASYDLPLLRGKLNGRYLGLGVHAYRDKAGKSEFGDTQAGLSLAYDLKFSERHRVAFGIQGSYGQRSAMLSALRWDSQYAGSFFDASLPSGEGEFDQRTIFFDLAGGAYWRGIIGGRDLSFGAAVFHPHEPNVSLLGGGGDRLLRRYTIHGDATLTGERWVLRPKFYASKQGGAFELVFGALAERQLGVDSRFTKERTASSFHLGLFYRWQDALIPMVQFDLRRMLTVGVSYDVNISRLRFHSNYQGGFEVSLVYHGALSDRRRKLKNGQAK